MAKLLATAAAVLWVGALVAGPAHANFQGTLDLNGTQQTIFDNNLPAPGSLLDQNPTAGIIQINNEVVGGVIVGISIATAAPGVTSELNSNSLAVSNTNPFAITATVALSATDFLGPVNSFSASGSGTFQNAVGATMENAWYDSPSNTQGALPGSCLNGAVGTLTTSCPQPGLLVDSGVFTNTGSPNSYSFNFAGPVSDPGAYSMTMSYQFTLPAAGADCNTATGLGCPTLVSRGQALEKANIPEPASFAVLGIGLVGLGLIRKKLRA